MNNSGNYRGTCFCGAVEVSVSGEPAAMGYCHCESCRKWSASPMNSFILWPAAAVQVTKGKELIQTYNKTPRSTRAWCKNCGGHLFAEHPHWGLTDVYAATTPDFPYAPAVHVNYQEAVCAVRDELPKMKDVPKELGGSGEPAVV